MTTATATRARTAAKPAREMKVADRQRLSRATSMFDMLRDATRLRIILMLAEGERHVGAMCAEIGQSQPAVSHHLSGLRHSDIVEPRRVGKQVYYSLTDRGRDAAEAGRRAMET